MVLTENGHQCSDQASSGLLDAQLDLYWNTFAVIKSMAFKSALDLRIADAIHHHGGAATVADIATTVSLHPSKIPCLRRLMRVLTVSGIFSVSGEENVYELTPASRLLVGSKNLAAIMSMILHPTLVVPFLGVGDWFRRETAADGDKTCIFKQAHGESLWELADRDAAFDALINDGMVSDSRFIMDVVVREHGEELFGGVGSLLDLAGGLGAAAQAISKGFPEVRCSVMDLGHVVAKAPRGTNVEYVAGDMFESVPLADAIFLKWVLHDWGDEDCVKILKNCKKAIPPRDAGGKVIIMDIVVGAGPSDQKHREVQALFDMYIMFVNGIERDEQEWKKVFMEAGFSGYKIMPVLGFRSIIEVYP
uniref:acetylserotonin O-methyltransferase n=1 Tax=Leersia perrieri TaxID=77586 RepID=A0A0D9WIN0_9ORYZ